MFMGANYSTGAVFHATPAPSRRNRKSSSTTQSSGEVIPSAIVNVYKIIRTTQVEIHQVKLEPLGESHCVMMIWEVTHNFPSIIECSG